MPRYPIVLDTCCPVDVLNSPFLQTRNEFGCDAGLAESLSRLPYFPATNIPVVTRWTVRVHEAGHRQVHGDRVLQVLVQPCGK
jgi:hypothetical protein